METITKKINKNISLEITLHDESVGLGSSKKLDHQIMTEIKAVDKDGNALLIDNDNGEELTSISYKVKLSGKQITELVAFYKKHTNLILT